MGLRQTFHDETVSKLPLRPVLTIAPSSTVRKAVRKMKKHGLGCLFVADEFERPLGRFTERDLIRELGRNPTALDQPVSTYMTPNEECLSESDPIEAVFNEMKDRGRRFICITEGETGKMIGLTGQKSLMEYIAENFPRQVKVQMMESKLYMDDREGA